MSKKLKEKAAPQAEGPAIAWVIAAANVAIDSDSQVPSAMQIVEDLFLPAEVFESGEDGMVITGMPFTLLVSLDWRWPNEVASTEPALFTLRWVTPNGDSYTGFKNDPIERPEGVNRKKLEVKMEGVPVNVEGIYCFDLMINGTSKAMYPIRIRAEQPAPHSDEAAKAKTPSRPRKSRKAVSEGRG